MKCKLLFILCLFICTEVFSQNNTPQKLRIGTTISVFGGLNGLTYENFVKAKEAGIDCIEISLTNLVNGENPIPDDNLKERFRKVKADADKAGIEIWSIHMPYGADCDPSHIDEKIRISSENFYKRNLDVVSVLKPRIILFHPSWRLGLNERPERISQLTKTMKSININVRKMNAHIVLENLLGYKLLRSEGVERPLGRTVEEMLEIMSHMPDDIYAAIDMNHIKNPEKLIDALGGRVKHVHIADGNGEKECHFLPGRGENNWNLILRALDNAGYTGPFLYEIKGSEVKDLKELKTCYEELYSCYIEFLKKE